MLIISAIITLGGIAASICTLGHICETASRKYVANAANIKFIEGLYPY